MRLSSYATRKVADFLRGIPFGPPPTVYLALSQRDPRTDGSGLLEPTDALYQRQGPVAFFDPVDDTDYGGSVMLSSNELLFPGTDFGIISHAALYDSITGGNLLFYAPLPNPHQCVSMPGHFFPNAAFAAGPGFVTLRLGGVIGKPLATAVLRWASGESGTLVSGPAGAKLALSSADPTWDGSGLSEPSGANGYVRPSVSFAAPTTLGDGRTILRTSQATELGAALTAPWVLTHWALVGSGNDLLAFGPISGSPLTIEASPVRDVRVPVKGYNPDILFPATEQRAFQLPAGKFGLSIGSKNL